MSSRKEAEAILLEQVLKLPATFEMEVPSEYLDRNGHVNMGHYSNIANRGMGHFMQMLGLHHDYFTEGKRGFFALRQVLSFLNEMHVGDQISVHAGLVDFDPKRLHFMLYIVNHTRHKLASSDERLAMLVDLTTRKSTTYEPEIVATFEKIKAEHYASGWIPELSGAISLKK